jgi:hypothetical protein
MLTTLTLNLEINFHLILHLGVLCYDNEPITADPNVKKAVSCVIFDANKKQYALYAQYTAITKEKLQALYEKFAGKSYPIIQPRKNKNGGFLFQDHEQFQMIAQLTRGGFRQLHFEVILDSY